MIRSATTALLAAALIIVAGCQQAPKSPSDNPVAQDAGTEPSINGDYEPLQASQSLMRAKLAHAQAVLEGIAIEDFDQVAKNADRLTRISQEADWQVHRTIEYTVFSSEFRRITQDMARNAAARNVHAATLDYMQMTMTCVKCHSHMRSEGLAVLDVPAPLASRRAGTDTPGLSRTP